MSDSDKADRNTCVCQKSRRRCFVLSPNIKEFLNFPFVRNWKQENLCFLFGVCYNRNVEKEYARRKDI